MNLIRKLYLYDIYNNIMRADTLNMGNQESCIVGPCTLVVHGYNLSLSYQLFEFKELIRINTLHNTYKCAHIN